MQVRNTKKVKSKAFAPSSAYNAQNGPGALNCVPVRTSNKGDDPLRVAPEHHTLCICSPWWLATFQKPETVKAVSNFWDTMPSVAACKKATKRAMLDMPSVLTLRRRLIRILRKLASQIRKLRPAPSLKELLDRCEQLFPVPCKPTILTTIRLTDTCRGGFPLWFWMANAGPTWIVRIMSRAHKVRIIDWCTSRKICTQITFLVFLTCIKIL